MCMKHTNFYVWIAKSASNTVNATIHGFLGARDEMGMLRDKGCLHA